jgi:general secretion pathway protein G
MTETTNIPPLQGEGNHAEHGGGAAAAASALPRADLCTSPPPSAVPLPLQGRNEKGFTLVEMMVVIVIIGLLATVVIINVMPATDRAAQTRVKADLDTLSQALDMYRLENMRYPTAQEGLAALQPNYVRRLPNDPWNNPYVYVSPGANGAPYQVASLGADGREGGTGENADITN